MARALYVRQKKILDKWIADMIADGDTPTFDKLPMIIWIQLENIYDYELLFQDTQRYITNKYFDIIYK